MRFKQDGGVMPPSTHNKGLNMNAAKLLAASAVFAVATAATTASAGATYSIEDAGGTLAITVDADGATLDASQVVAGVTNIVKRGPGTLVASAISSYEGDFDIEEGIWQCKVSGDFGKTSTSASAGTVHVRDGASIECVSPSSTTNPGMLEGKTVHLYGAAADGTSGKIVLSAATTMGWKGFGTKMTIILHDDATFSSAKRFTMFGTFDLGGHALSLAGRQQFDLGGTVTNGGSLVVKGSTTLMVQQNPLVFASDCAATGLVRVESGATLNLKVEGVAANGWTLQNDGGALTCNAVKWPTDTTIGVWDGPVVFSGSAKVANYGAHNSGNAGQYNVTNTVFNLSGAISGTSGSLAIGPGWLNLHGPAANAYTRAVTVRGKSSNQVPNGQNAQPVLSGSGGIGVWNGASVFPDASSITLNDSARIEFMDDTASTVGALRFVGDTSTFTGDPGDDTQSIKGGSAMARPTIAGLTKTGTNTLVIATPARFAGPAAISNGTLRIAKNYQFGNAGLNETHYVPTTSTYNWLFNQFYKPPAYAGTGTNTSYDTKTSGGEDRTTREDNGTIETGPRRCCSADGWTSYSGKCQGYLYTGYVWNRTGAEVTWQVLADNEHRVYVYFGEKNAGTELVFINSSSEKAQPQEVTLPAGPTKICIWIVATSNGGTAKPYNYDKLGLMYATNPNVAVEDFDPENPDLSAFRQMADSGAGELFTVDTLAPGDFPIEDRIGKQPVFSSLAFTHGATLDLDGNAEFFVKDLAGSPAVMNVGTLNVTNNWAIFAADFPKADETVRHPMTVDGALVFADGATFSIDDKKAIARDADGFVVVTATDGITGVPTAADPDCPVELIMSGNSLLLRRRIKPLVIVIR